MRNHRQFVRRGLTGVAGALLVLGVTGGFAAAQAAPASTTLPNSQSFSFNDTTQYFTVPAGVTSLQVTGWGGAGGNGGAGAGVTAAPGGLGAEITTTAPVSPGDTLVVMLGGQGASDNPDLEESGTFNAGGLSSGDAMNGGAGATGLYDSPTWGGGGGGGGTAVIDANSGAVILAAGGGGGGGGDGANYGGPGGAGGNGITAVQGGAGSGNGAGGGGSFASSGSAAGTDGGNSEWGSDAGSGGGGGGGFDDAQLGGNGGGTGGSGGYDGGGGGGGGGAGQSYSSPTDTTVQLSNGPEANGGVTINWANPAPGITVSSSDDAAALGQSVTLTATLTPVGNTNGAIPSGTVDFFDNGSDTPIGYGVLTGSTPDVATFTASALPLGSNSITAVYFGDANFPAATSPALTQLVGHKTTLALTTKVTTVQAGQTVKVNATVKEKGAPLPTGTVNLFEYQPGGVRSRSPFATLTLAPGSNKVCFKLTTLPLGTDDLYATYVGDTDNAPSVSGTVSVTVQGVGEV